MLIYLLFLLLFLVVSSPIVYKFTNSIFKNICILASKDGCPTLCGLLVHTIVFMLLARYLLELNKINEGIDEDEMNSDIEQDIDEEQTSIVEISEKDKKKEEINNLITKIQNLDNTIKDEQVELID